ncbi:hypothetical protein F5Y16DRAFT_391529 [Xylariaceae sp. FL0255]|nr:hypothetical protein F5Y16DRAFT_391529 [Xylariaceae sp. FL0255]
MPENIDMNQAGITQATGPTSSEGLRIYVVYRVVTQIPNRLIRRWHPTRKLEETTFAQLMDEVTDSKDARSLIFRIEVNDVGIVDDIGRGNELEFDQLKKLIKRTIKEALGSHGSAQQPLACVIEIEPVLSNDVISHTEVDEVGDFTI